MSYYEGNFKVILPYSIIQKSRFHTTTIKPFKHLNIIFKPTQKKPRVVHLQAKSTGE